MMPRYSTAVERKRPSIGEQAAKTEPLSNKDLIISSMPISSNLLRSGGVSGAKAHMRKCRLGCGTRLVSSSRRLISTVRKPLKRMEAVRPVSASVMSRFKSSTVGLSMFHFRWASSKSASLSKMRQASAERRRLLRAKTVL